MYSLKDVVSKLKGVTTCAGALMAQDGNKLVDIGSVAGTFTLNKLGLAMMDGMVDVLPAPAKATVKAAKAVKRLRETSAKTKAEAKPAPKPEAAELDADLDDVLGDLGMSDNIDGLIKD